MNIIFHGKLGVVKGFDVGALPPFKTGGELSLNFEIFLHLLCVCAVIYKMGKKSVITSMNQEETIFALITWELVGSLCKNNVCVMQIHGTNTLTHSFCNMWHAIMTTEFF
jgi:hypothetical protein